MLYKPVPYRLSLLAFLYTFSFLITPLVHAQQNGQVGLSPTSLTFPTQAIGAVSPSQAVTLTNTGTGPLGISSIGPNSFDYQETDNCPLSPATLAIGAHCTINVTFSPSIAGPDPGAILVTNTSTVPTVQIPLSGNGALSAVNLSPTDVQFGPVAVGASSAPQPVVFSNNGTGSLTINAINISGDFTKTSACGSTLGANSNCQISVRFNPSATGPRTADLSVVSSAPDSPHIAHLTGNGNIRQLGGFTTNTLARNDDGSTLLVPLAFTLNFFGANYSSLFVNNNGNVTLTDSLGTFTPFDLNSTQLPIIAPFFADVDTTNVRSEQVTYGTDVVNGRPAFGVNWQNVGYFASQADKLDSFQLVLINRSDLGAGNFDIEFNYDKIQWETGEASGGTGGLGGSSARAGYSNGTGVAGTSFELPGSAVNGALLDSNLLTGLIHNSLNSGIPGRYGFQVRNGVVLSADLGVTMTHGPDPVQVGLPETYTLHVTNSGPNDAPNAVLTDTLPANSTLVSINPGAIFACVVGTSSVTCTAATLSHGASATITIVVTPSVAGAVTNSASISSGVPDPNAANNSVSQSATALGTGLLSSNQANFGPHLIGSAGVEQDILVSNTGTALTITGIALGGASPHDFIETNNCPINPAVLAPGATCTIRLTFLPLVTGARAALVTITFNQNNVTGLSQTIALNGSATAPAPTTTTIPVTFSPGTNVSKTVTLNCPSATVPCTDPNAHSLKLSIAQVNTSFTLTVTAIEVSLSEANGVCQNGHTETTDFDCRFKTNFHIQTLPSGDVIVPQCDPYSKGNCVFYRVSNVPPASAYQGPVTEYIAWNNNAFLPPPIYSSTNPRLFDDPDSPPFDHDHQFVFDITDYFNSGGGQVGLDPGLSGHTKQFSDFVVAFPAALPSPAYTVTVKSPGPAPIGRGVVIPVAFTLTQGNTAITNALVAPNTVSIGVLNAQGVRQSVLATDGSVPVFKYDPPTNTYSLLLATEVYAQGNYQLLINSNLFLQQTVNFTITDSNKVTLSLGAPSTSVDGSRNYVVSFPVPNQGTIPTRIQIINATIITAANRTPISTSTALPITKTINPGSSGLVTLIFPPSIGPSGTVAILGLNNEPYTGILSNGGTITGTWGGSLRIVLP